MRSITLAVAALPGLTLLLLPGTSASGQTSIGGVCFVDRNATGEIVLGSRRGALAAFDYDRDGWLDLAIADFGGLPNRLYRNLPHPTLAGNRTFEFVASAISDDDGTLHGFGGTLAADYDNDGDQDVFFVGYQASDVSHGLLYRNDGGGAFTNISIASGVRGFGNIPESASWTDFDLDGWIDLLVINITAGSAQPARLLRNNGDGTFSDATSAIPALPTPGHCYSHAWVDYDRDGWNDCVLINNQNPPPLLRNVPGSGGGRAFQNVAAAAGYTFLGTAPMGIAIGDSDGDGDFDFAVTDAIDGNYYRNNGDGTFSEITPFATFFGWGLAWIDADNDGDLDHYQAGSWPNPNADRLMRNDGRGAWSNISAALNAQSLASQYSVQIDFNNDGRQDIITVNPGTPGQSISVYDNISTTGNNWLKLRLIGDVGAGVIGPARINADALGAVVRVHTGGAGSSSRTRIAQVISGSSTTSTEDTRVHFGLGTAASADWIEVVWPRSGSLASRSDLYPGPIAINQIRTIQPKRAGDANGDGAVNINDLLAAIIAWGPCQPVNQAPACPADVDRNGTINIADLLVMIINWG